MSYICIRKLNIKNRNMLQIRITNQEKFNKVSNVDLSCSSETIYRNSFDGNVLIQLESGKELEFDGQHGVNDFESDYGFVIDEKDIFTYSDSKAGMQKVEFNTLEDLQNYINNFDPNYGEDESSMITVFKNGEAISEHLSDQNQVYWETNYFN